MSNIHSHYDNLKVSRDAPPEIIRAAYRTLSQKYHPDRNRGNIDAARIMMTLNAAYETLSDPEKRREHDAWIAAMEGGESKQPHTQHSGSSHGNHGFTGSEKSPQQASGSEPPPDEPGDSDGIAKPQGFDPSAVPKRDHSYRYDILPGAAVVALCKSIISSSGFHGSPTASGLVGGISGALGFAVGFALSRYVRTKVTKNRGSGFVLPLSISIGLSLLFLTVANILSHPNIGGASPQNQQPATDFVNPFPPYSPGGASPQNQQPATGNPFADLMTPGGASPQNQQPSTLPEGYVIDPPGGASPQNQQPATGVFDPFAPAPTEPKEVTELRKAAAQGDAAAQSNLGLIYAIGRGVPANFIEAVKWLRLAAAQGDAAAQSNLGLVYESGQGVPKSKVVAYALFNLATSNDRNHTATDNRNGMSERMTAQEIEVAQALTREMAKPGNLLAALDNYVSRSR